MSIRRKTLLAVLLAGALAIPGHATAIPLSDLFAGEDITVLDKLFSDFTLLRQETFGDASANPEDIEVTALEDDPMNPGIQFEGDVRAESAGSAFLSFTFEVSTLSGEPLIIGNSLVLTDFLLDAAPGASIAIAESVFRDTGGPIISGPPIGSKSVFAHSAGFEQLSDSAAFPPQSSVGVLKSIFVSAPGVFDLAVLQEFEQRFAQLASVPEPGSLALVGVALAGLGFSRRKRAN